MQGIILDSNGVKLQQISDESDRALRYRQWTRGKSPGYATDADLIHWKFIDNKPRVYLLTELTLCKGTKVPPLSYCRAILDRYKNRDKQAVFAEALGEYFDAPVFIVVFTEDLTQPFWIYFFKLNFWNIMYPQEWIDFMQAIYDRKKY